MLKDANVAYDHFLKKFILSYDKASPNVEIINFTPWITKVRKKSSKRKQSPYEKFLENCMNENEHNSKT